jgi:peptidoglycan pentaglycine glycine transferase (the first glycine)
LTYVPPTKTFFNPEVEKRETPFYTQMMQIRLIEDSAEWNNALLDLSATLYHSWEWGELVATDGWRVWRVLASDGSSPRAAVQVLERRLPIPGLSILYAPRGIATRPSDSESFISVGTWLKDFVRRRRAILLRADPLILDTSNEERALHRTAEFVDLPNQWSRWNQSRSNMVVDIKGTEQEILRKMRPKHRQHINRALRDGHLIPAQSETPQLREFHDLLLKSSERQGFAARPFNYLCHVRQKLVAEERGLLLLARKGDRAVAGMMCTRFGSVCYFLYGGFDWKERQVHAMEVLHWKAIQWAKSVGCTHYDLGGSGTRYPPQEGNLGFGLYDFKKGLGAELRYLLGYFDMPGNMLLYKLFRLGEENMLRGPLFNTAVRARTWFLRTLASRKVSVKTENAPENSAS